MINHGSINIRLAVRWLCRSFSITIRSTGVSYRGKMMLNNSQLTVLSEVILHGYPRPIENFHRHPNRIFLRHGIVKTTKSVYSYKICHNHRLAMVLLRINGNSKRISSNGSKIEMCLYTMSICTMPISLPFVSVSLRSTLASYMTLDFLFFFLSTGQCIETLSENDRIIVHYSCRM